ncbi:helix-turn-helix domain-containing protein [Streptomyces sp. NPDC055036]
MPLRTNGGAVRERRLLKGLTIAEFARHAEYSANHVSQIELGHENGGLGFLRAATEILDCTIEDITEGVVPRRSPSEASGTPAAGAA